MIHRNCLYLLIFLFFPTINYAQTNAAVNQLTVERIYSGEFAQERFGPSKWLKGGDAYTTLEASTSGKGKDIVQYDSDTGKRTILINATALIPSGAEEALDIANYSWSKDEQKLLIFTNTKRVWRTNTKGDYWIYDLSTKHLNQIGKDLPSSSLMFAKFSPNNQQIAFVSENNLFVQDLQTEVVKQLTFDGTAAIINGNFDWVYEEEFACRDGFRWSADGAYLAFWQVDASEIKDFLMINNTDNVYAKTIPLQYPKVGEDPSAVRIGTVHLATGAIVWMDIPGDSKQHYLPRAQWVGITNLLQVQQLNRKQNEKKIWLCDAVTGDAKNTFTEREETWLDITHPDPTLAWDMTDLPIIEQGKAFLNISEKDGWRQLYRVAMNGNSEKILSSESFDIARFHQVDESKNSIYVNASPDNPTQRYLYQMSLNGREAAEKLTPSNQPGVHRYNISPNGKYAINSWSNTNTPPTIELVALPSHKTLRTLVANEAYNEKIEQLDFTPVEFFQVTTEDNVTMDGLMIKPKNFDANKKYPVLFHVYGEPWGQTATDSWTSLWHRMMVEQGYIIISMDNRGTPALKGRDWRKSIYRKIGVINSRDQAMGAKALLQKHAFIDRERVAVWGWSGGGSMTLNLLFRYPEIYKTGVSIAPVGNQLLYDNVYQERYMGVPWENKADFIEGSPVTYAKNLQGNLLLIHGTGDDNVHYQNAEVVINELIKHNRPFQMMAYPNRSHGIREGKNTTQHLYNLMTNYLLEHAPIDSKE